MYNVGVETDVIISCRQYNVANAASSMYLCVESCLAQHLLTQPGAW